MKLTLIEKRTARLEEVFLAMPDERKAAFAEIVMHILPLAEKNGAVAILSEDVIDAILGELTAIVPTLALRGNERAGAILSAAFASHAPALRGFVMALAEGRAEPHA
jgi:hypothetical protein